MNIFESKLNRVIKNTLKRALNESEDEQLRMLSCIKSDLDDAMSAFDDVEGLAYNFDDEIKDKAQNIMSQMGQLMSIIDNRLSDF